MRSNVPLECSHQGNDYIFRKINSIQICICSIDLQGIVLEIHVSSVVHALRGLQKKHGSSIRSDMFTKSLLILFRNNYSLGRSRVYRTK
jgi:hypothetical protein